MRAFTKGADFRWNGKKRNASLSVDGQREKEERKGDLSRISDSLLLDELDSERAKGKA